MNILGVFLSLNTTPRPNSFWWLCRKNPMLPSVCKSVVKTISLLFTRYNISVCSACGTKVELYVNHRALWCPTYETVRQKFWNRVWHKFGDELYLRLFTMNDDTILNAMYCAYKKYMMFITQTLRMTSFVL